MSGTIIIGIDHGYAAIKSKNFSFPTGLVEYEHEPYTSKDVLEYGGKYYVVGSGRQPLQKDKTLTEDYYLLTLAAIAKELEYRGAERTASVHLAAGLPLTSFGRDKKKFRAYLLRDGKPASFRYEGRDYAVTVTEVTLFPQGYAAALASSQSPLYSVSRYAENSVRSLAPPFPTRPASLGSRGGPHGELLDEPSVIVADIGGWTVDLMRLDNRVPNAAACRSLELGMIRCLDEISEQIRRSLGLSMTAAQIESVLRGGVSSVEENARQIIHREAGAYVRRLLSAIAESGLDARAMPAIFLGGGAALLKRHVTAADGLCRPFILNDVCMNAKGFEHLAGQLLRGMGGG